MLYLLLWLCVAISLVNSEDCKTKHKERFFNVSREIDDAIDRNKDYGKIITDNNVPENYTISNNTQRVLNGMNSTCRYYTDVNSYKYQLQEVLFHKDVLPNELLEKITSLLINLQVAASSLQHFRMIVASNKPCLEFTAEEYKHIYAVSNKSNDLMYELKLSTKTWINQMEHYPLT
ncbi:uncharacterized protein [Dysidea avara]|uniref:uncharacterized protein n=1 Tax=Dysidea avara TaxID=196820 RepID=UPI003316875F